MLPLCSLLPRQFPRDCQSALGFSWIPAPPSCTTLHEAGQWYTFSVWKPPTSGAPEFYLVLDIEVSWVEVPMHGASCYFWPHMHFLLSQPLLSLGAIMPRVPSSSSHPLALLPQFTNVGLRFLTSSSSPFFEPMVSGNVRLVGQSGPVLSVSLFP